MRNFIHLFADFMESIFGLSMLEILYQQIFS